MYCSSCGIEMPDHFRFCSQCGAPAQGGLPQRMASGPLRRSRADKKLAGVCAGLARYIHVDVILIRIMMLAAAFSGVGIVFYFICWILMPLDPLMLPPPAQPMVTAPPVRL